jgi:hypothetical protein
MGTSSTARLPPARRRPAVLAWALAGLAVLTVVPTARLTALQSSAGVDPVSGAAVAPVVLATVSAATVGALLARRRPRHPVGWLLLGLGLALAMNGLVEPYVKYGLLVRPGSLPAARHLVGFLYVLILVALSCVGFVLLLTPTGSLPSPRWRWWPGWPPPRRW